MRRWVETWLARLTEWITELIPEMGWCISEWTICHFQWGDGWLARNGDNRQRVGTARGLNRDQIVKIARFTGCKNFVGKRKKFIFNAFVVVWRRNRLRLTSRWRHWSRTRCTRCKLKRATSTRICRRRCCLATSSTSWLSLEVSIPSSLYRLTLLSLGAVIVPH